MVESDWVSVRPNAFEENERHKLVFMVAWNDVEGKFAVTCHDRTVQRRRALLSMDPPGSLHCHTAGSEGSGSEATPRANCTPKGRHTVRNTDNVDAEGESHRCTGTSQTMSLWLRLVLKKIRLFCPKVTAKNK